VGDLVIVFLRARARVWARVVVWWLAPLWLLASVLGALFDGHWSLGVVALALGPALRAPIALLAGRLLFTPEVPLGGVLVDAASRVGALVVGWAAALLAFGLGTMLCGFGGPLTVVPFVFAPEAALLERVGGRRSVERSMRLALGQSAGGLTAGVIGMVFPMFAGVAAESAGSSLVHGVLQVPPLFGSVWDGQTTPYLVAGVLLGHLFASVWRLLLYVDARTRDEGWDLQVGLGAVASALSSRGRFDGERAT
jgi:hypothetical protein